MNRSLWVATLLCSAALAQTPQRLYVPDSIADPPWLTARRATQIEAAQAYETFHDFSFSNGRAQSGIGFHNQITDESGKHWQPIHYDHGNGVAAADVDNDGLYDLYFCTQSGSNELWRNLGDGTFSGLVPSFEPSEDKTRTFVSWPFAILASLDFDTFAGSAPD